MIEININPIAFTVGSISIRWYGIMVALAILEIIIWLTIKTIRGTRLSHDTVITLALVGIPSGLIFSRLLHVLDNIVVAKLHPELIGQVIDYTQNPGQIIGAGGLSIYGAVLGAALGIWIYSRFSHIKFSYIADLLAPAVILAQAIGRIGCTINGCCYGSPTSLPWGIIYNHPDSLCALGTAVHPTQVYEIIYDLIVLAILLVLGRRLKPEGSLFLIYLSLYSLWRIGIDFLRDGAPFLFSLHQAQVIGIIVLAITIPLLVFKTRLAKKQNVIS